VKNFLSVITLFTCAWLLTACDSRKIKAPSYACDDLDMAYFGARYHVQQQGLNDEHVHHEEASVFTLWRIDNKVLHEYDDQGISFLYSNGSGERLISHQFFDRDKRAIEFDSKFIPENQKNSLWSQKKNLVSDALLSQMKKSGEHGKNCNKVEHLTFESEEFNAELHWLPAFELPFKLEIVQKGQHKHWQLVDIVGNEADIKQAMLERNKYLSTDFADIGDNETDPFLRNMINLGFIDHGNSGFYDSDGNDIGSHHH